VAGAVTTAVGAATDVPGSAVVAAQKYVLKASIFFIGHTYRTSLNKDETLLISRILNDELNGAIVFTKDSDCDYAQIQL
jgi:hypothetical protein